MLDLSASFFASPVLAQGANWLPAFVTPLWLIAVGLLLGTLAAVVVYGTLVLLSFIAPLGNLANRRGPAITASLIVGSVFASFLCLTYVPRGGDAEYQTTLIPPLVVIGLIGGFAVIYGMWYRTRQEWPQILSEGVVPYLLCTAATLGVIGLAATPWTVDRDEILQSIGQVNLFSDGTVIAPVEIAGIGNSDPAEAPFVAANIPYQLRSLAEIEITSNRNIALSDSPEPVSFTRAPTRVFAGEPLVYRYADRETPPIPGDSSSLHIQNGETDEALVTFKFTSRPDVPEATSVVAIAAMFFLLITSIMAFRQAAPRVWALALSTAKNEMAQPLYLLLLGMGIAVVLFFGFFPFNTLGEDIRVLKDSGVTLIMVLGMLQAVWSAGTTVSDEIEGRTALTVLSKPVSRRSFVLGKYVGIMLAVLVLFAIIAAVLLVVISYKPIYESRETTRAATTWQTGHAEIMSTIPVLGLYFMETCAIGAVAVALATRLPLLANFVTCFLVYVIGNLTSILVISAGQKFELVEFVGKLIAVVVPNLNLFNVQSAIDADIPIPILYLAGTFNYLGCFVIMIWMFAMLLFQDRDLA